MKIGILGGGQLGRMLALAGNPLGHRFSFYDVAPDVPSHLLGKLTVGSFTDEKQLKEFAAGVDAVTFEFENVPLSAARTCANVRPLFPSLMALEIGQDRIKEKTFFQSLNIATPKFAEIKSLSDLQIAVRDLGLPGVVKTTTMGYDGKGQFVLKQTTDIDEAWKALNGRTLIYEQFIPFTRELSLIAVRGKNGELKFYPLTQNIHREGILRTSTVPASGDMQKLQTQAEGWVRLILEKLEYVGVFALELFDKNGELFANEMAPRVHNSGHWTMDGAVTSQFENHIRAVTGLPLGDTSLKAPTTMLNLIGKIPAPSDILTFSTAHLHLYDKEPRPGRKVGHINIVPSTEQVCNRIISLL